MERIRRRSSCSCSCSGDDLALVKAAAWSWFQHGTGSEESMQEFNARRTLQDPKPSRYKLEEAMELANQGTNIDSDARLKSPTRASYRADSLLDRFEIESISRRLDQLIIKSSGDRDREGGYDDKRFLVGSLAKLSDDTDLRCRSKTSTPPPQLQSLKPLVEYLGRQESETENYTIRRGKKKKMSKNNFRGFWPMHVVMCGTHEDVVLGTTRSLVDNPQRQRQRPEKGKVYSQSQVPVVELPNCRPGRQTRHLLNLVYNSTSTSARMFPQ